MVKRISAITLALIIVSGCQQTVPADTGGGQDPILEKKVKEPLAGIAIENSVPFTRIPPIEPRAIADRYYFGDTWSAQDFNNDGHIDYLFTGTMIPEAASADFVDTGDTCGKNALCKGDMPGPSLFVADGKGNFDLRDDLFVDNRKTPGQSLARQNLVGDFNGDGVEDVFIADHGLGTHKGFRDSYFLSQPDGSWIESSETHLSTPDYRVFDHGGAVGDIDADGDLDVVLTELEGNLICWVNNGTGYMTKNTCGMVHAFGIELADMDRDGDLDLVSGGSEAADYRPHRSKPSIIWNDGNGNFKGSIHLPSVNGNWKDVPEVSVADLDNDGDYDIVVSRVGKLYVGTSVQILENKKGKFESTHIVIDEQPKGYKPTSEGNKYNNFIKHFVFDDVNNDGGLDIILLGSTDLTYGGVLLNNGAFNFAYLGPKKPDNPIEIIRSYRFKRVWK